MNKKFIAIHSSEENIKKYLINNSIEIVIFSVNVKDITPLKIARIAKKLNICTMHILDFWNGYKARMKLDNKVSFTPDYYFVPDLLAKKEAIKDGINKSIIFVSGQPDFIDIKKDYLIQKNNIPKEFKKINNNKIILFVSEPVSLDQGKSLLENKNFRGYTEMDVMNLLIKNLHNLNNKDIKVVVIPHPRDNYQKVKKVWKKLGGNMHGFVIKKIDPIKLLPHVEGVVGMSSTLLHISWLLGKKVISIQPNLRIKNLETIKSRSGLVFVKNIKLADSQIKKWLVNIKKNRVDKFRKECSFHLDASKKIVLEIDKIL